LFECDILPAIMAPEKTEFQIAFCRVDSRIYILDVLMSVLVDLDKVEGAQAYLFLSFFNFHGGVEPEFGLEFVTQGGANWRQ